MLIELNDAKLFCRQLGDGDPILFVHGFPLSGEMWLPAAEKLSDRRRCIIPDLRGHGKSSASPDASIARFTDDLAALLDKLREWRPVVLVGLSMGGIIAFDFFRRYRNRLRALVLCDCRADSDSLEGAALRETLAQSVLAGGSRVAAESMIPRLFAPGVSPQIRDRWREIIVGTDPVGVAAAARALAYRPDSIPTLPKIDCPTLLIVGAQDAITPPALMEEMHRIVPRSQLTIIADAGHMPPVEQPEAFTIALRGFLESL